jgi:hypothetical protein
MVSQLFPRGVGESPRAELPRKASPTTPARRSRDVKSPGTVRDGTSHRAGRLARRAIRDVLFGRNEGGGQRFHRYVDALLAARDDELAALLAGGVS